MCLCFSWFVQTVHGRHFSKRKWEEFVRSRPIPGSSVAFAEIEVMLCNIPNRMDLQTDKMEEEHEREGFFFRFPHLSLSLLLSLSPKYYDHRFECLLILNIFFRPIEKGKIGRGRSGKVEEKERGRKKETRRGMCFIQ